MPAPDQVLTPSETVGSIVILLNGASYEASIYDVRTGQDPRTDLWAAMGSSENGQVWAIGADTELQAIAKILTVAIGGV